VELNYYLGGSTLYHQKFRKFNQSWAMGNWERGNSPIPIPNFQTGREPDNIACILTTAPITAIAGAVN
jgi:hypothetical protein